MRRVVVVDPDPGWPDRFQEEARRIRAALGEDCVYVHHIGSTAVPGLRAKPILDLMPVVRDIRAVDRRHGAMAELGYEGLGEYGLPGRRYFRKGGDERTHHVHVYEVGHPDIDRHLAFRDYLRDHPDAARRYGELKAELARRFADDVEAYMDGKHDFIQEMERAALAWWSRVPVLLVTGPVGAGKTTVADAVSDLLREAGTAHACIDFDALTEVSPPSPGDRFGLALGLANLAAVWRTFRSCGARCLVLATVVEERSEVEGFRQAVPGAEVTVVRLRASMETLEERIRRRETGLGRDWSLRRSAELAALMEERKVEDFAVDTDGRSVEEIAREILERLGGPRWGRSLS
ncbi:MAG: GrpB family protein [Firmicutes bacterium]|nr:GrpB family protein [Bacillota bacterium]